MDQIKEMEKNRKVEGLDLLTEQVIGCAYKVANKLGCGFLEKVYERALLIELKKTGLDVRSQFPIAVHYDGELIGDFVADLLIAERLIVELKAVESLDKVHYAQCLNYLKASGLKACLLLNFGRPKIQVKRFNHHF